MVYNVVGDKLQEEKGKNIREKIIQVTFNSIITSKMGFMHKICMRQMKLKNSDISIRLKEKLEIFMM